MLGMFPAEFQFACRRDDAVDSVDRRDLRLTSKNASRGAVLDHCSANHRRQTPGSTY